MRTCFVILLLICTSLMYTESDTNTTSSVGTTPASTPKAAGSENCVATLVTLVMTLVTVFILQAKNWFC